ncbi:MAG: FG-GAP repeat protein, partial [Planctomycetes bacterium]|nr:FG-GAP repeat protein [Planctomycetota bacterium]
TYRVTAPGGTFDQGDNGIYEIFLTDGAVTDTRSGTPNSTRAQRLGEFEVDIEFTGQIVVNSLADVADDVLGDGISLTAGGDSTLRSAIQTANEDAGLNTIVLEAGSTYVLDIGPSGEDLAASGDLDITQNLLILGNGATIQINGGLDRVFDIHSGATLTLEELTITGGSVSGAGTDGSGGGIRNAGTLNLTASLLHGNSATTGGAIASTGTLAITNSTISTNTATDAGGIEVSGGTATLLHATLTANDATTATGGLRQSSTGSVTPTSTLVAGNTSPTDPDTTGTFTATFSLIGDAGTATGLTDGVDSNQVGASGSEIDPLLGPLANNTGPTMTHRLLAGSPAIDTADNASAPATDQRAITRPVNGNPKEDAFANADIGAVERFFGEISGITFRDTNGNGIQDAGEPGEPGFTVYLDINNNEVLDPGEPSTVSSTDDPATMVIDETGTYEFTLVEPGDHTVREFAPAEWDVTGPVRNSDEALFSLPRLRSVNGGNGSEGFAFTDSAGQFSQLFSIGDFNGDGFDDLADPANQQNVRLVFGRANEASGESDISIVDSGSDESGAILDTSVLSGGSTDGNTNAVAFGNLNEDKFSDVVLGRSDQNGLNNRGIVFVKFGSATPFGGPFDMTSLESGDGSLGFVVKGAIANDRIGQPGTIAVGDVNGDGAHDLLLGAPARDLTGKENAGIVSIILGPFGNEAVFDLANPPAGRVVEIRGEFSGDQIGVSLATADVTGDGKDDIVIGADNAFRNGMETGEIVIIPGDAALNGVIELGDLNSGMLAGLRIRGSIGLRLGAEVQLGDFDADGRSDVLTTGVFSANPIHLVPGEVFSSTTLVDVPQCSDPTFDLGDVNGKCFRIGGSNFSGIGVQGDFDGDGFDDFVFGDEEGALDNVRATGLIIVRFGQSQGVEGLVSQAPSLSALGIPDAQSSVAFARKFNEQADEPD